MSEADPPNDLDDPALAVREARQRFVAAFSSRCEAMVSLVDGARSGDAAGSATGLRQIAHKLAGLAGTVGFPATGTVASEIEVLCDEALASLSRGSAPAEPAPGRSAPAKPSATRGGRGRSRRPGLDSKALAARIATMRDTFARELAEVPEPTVAVPAVQAERPLRVLIADDDEDQRGLTMTALRSAGHEPMGLPSGEFVVEAARLRRPDVVLLDVNMPGLDGYSTCRALKSSPDLAAIPVVFMTSRNNLDERLAGLSLGADEYLVKPVDMRELLLRLKLISARPSRAAAPGEDEPAPGELPYEELAQVVRKAQALGPVAVVLVRLPWGAAEHAVSVLRDNMRRRDAMGRFSAGLRVLVMPGLAAPTVLPRVTEIINETVAAGIKGVHAGIAASAGPDGRTLESLLAEADEALAEARYLGEPAALKSGTPRAPAGPPAHSVLIADDDPEVVRIVDAQLRAAGYETRLAFDGDAAVAALEEEPPAVLVLDLMMPRRTGFEVLSAMRAAAGTARPRVVVLSARGREDDVTRAFELGADDYMTKPFSPQELMARISRLLR